MTDWLWLPFALWAICERILSYRERRQLQDEVADITEEAHKREMAMMKALREAVDGRIPVAVPIPSPAPMPRRVRSQPSPPPQEEPAGPQFHLDDEAEAYIEQRRAQGIPDEKIAVEVAEMQRGKAG